MLIAWQENSNMGNLTDYNEICRVSGVPAGRLWLKMSPFCHNLISPFDITTMKQASERAVGRG